MQICYCTSVYQFSCFITYLHIHGHVHIYVHIAVPAELNDTPLQDASSSLEKSNLSFGSGDPQYSGQYIFLQSWYLFSGRSQPSSKQLWNLANSSAVKCGVLGGSLGGRGVITGIYWSPTFSANVFLCSFGCRAFRSSGYTPVTLKPAKMLGIVIALPHALLKIWLKLQRVTAWKGCDAM